MRSIIRTVVLAVLAASLWTATPAYAGNVTVTLTPVFGPSVVTHGVPTAARVCNVSVAEGADGVTVLNAAKSGGCVSSFATTNFPGLGTFVECIDGVCGGADPRGAACWFWAMHENGLPTDYGVDGFQAQDGDVLSFVYEPWGAPAVLLCP